jgi:hypothetical protein
VSGGSDLERPGCAGAQAEGKTQLQLPATLSDPCQGPFVLTANINSIEPAAGSDYLPRLSADGRIVAFLASAPLVESSEFGSTGVFSDDLYVVDMASGLTRVQALRRLTAIAAGSARNFGRVEPIEDLGVSPDGSEIAFASRRTVFPLGSPSYVSPPLAAPTEESGPQELYDVDLANDTLTRVTRGFDGAPTQSANGVTALSGSPSFSTDGNQLAFSSTAPNLIYGDGNGASDVFVVNRKRFGATAVQQYISPPPVNPAGEPDWLLGVTARSRRDGSVLLEVFVPGAGQLNADAQSAVPLPSVYGSRAQHRRKRAGRRGRHATRTGAKPSIAMRSIAAAARTSGSEGLVSVPLVLAPRYRPLALQRGGQSATVRVAFGAPGHSLLRRSLLVTFVDPIAPHRRRGKHRAGHRAGTHR